MREMLIGAIAAGWLVAGLFFFRFWRRTPDRARTERPRVEAAASSPCALPWPTAQIRPTEQRTDARSGAPGQLLSEK